jgi:hypothetical protein
MPKTYIQDRVEKNIYEIIKKTRSKKEEAEQKLSQNEHRMKEAKIIKEKFNLHALKSELAETEVN